MNNTNKPNYLKTIEDVKAIENVSPKVSKKYVPIFTSDIINVLSPEFKFVDGCQPVASTTAHYVNLSDGTNTIRIYNSYDRKLALRFAFVEEVAIDLGVDRLIHLGNKAATFVSSLEDVKKEILTAVNTAVKINTYLSNVKITPEIAKSISNIVFSNIIKKEGFQEYTNYIDLLIPKVSIKAYIYQTLNKYIAGDYVYTIKGVKKNGKRKGSLFFKLKKENQLMNFIQEEYVELML